MIVATGAASDPPVLEGYEELATWPVEELLDGLPSSLETLWRPQRPVVAGDGRIALATASRWRGGVPNARCCRASGRAATRAASSGAAISHDSTGWR